MGNYNAGEDSGKSAVLKSNYNSNTIRDIDTNISRTDIARGT